MDNRPIGIFDSGVGGLTVVKEIIHLLPDEEILYLGDTARVPYGPRELDEVRGFVFEIVNFMRKQDVKLIVMACNTATAAGLQGAQEINNVPIIGVIEPGARAACLSTRAKKVGVIATKATTKSDAYRRIITTMDGQTEVFTRACPTLVNFIERGELEGSRIEEEVRSYLCPLIEGGIDVLILGCTHYPLIEGLIKKIVGEDIQIINSARVTAQEVKRILTAKVQLRHSDRPPGHRFLATGGERLFFEIGGWFLGREIEETETIDLRSP